MATARNRSLEEWAIPSLPGSFPNKGKRRRFRRHPVSRCSELSTPELKKTRAFGGCCNEFWYTQAGLAKGLWREEIPLVQGLFHTVIHEALRQMPDWSIGCRYAFSVNPGKLGKHYAQYLEPAVYRQFLATYSSAEAGAIWETVYRSLDLFREVAVAVAEPLGYHYSSEDRNVTAYLNHARGLPKEAKRIY